MKTDLKKRPVVPKQEKGARSDTGYSVQMQTQQEAVKLFKDASKRLLKVSEWHTLCGLVTAIFALTDSSGNKVRRNARQGDYLRINIPGPGPTSGDGFDWVKIKSIKMKSLPGKDYEEISMLVKPAKNPKDKARSTSHFFKKDASSTFIIIREANKVKAEVYGRNELPNLKQENAVDVVRNAIIAIGAMLGFSKLQWKKLVKGILKA